MASRRLFHRQNGELETAQQEKAISGVTRLKLRLASLAPVLKNHVNSDFFRKASDRIESIEYTLETLRVMKAFFDGTSLEEILPYVTRIWRAWWMEWFERIRM